MPGRPLHRIVPHEGRDGGARANERPAAVGRWRQRRWLWAWRCGLRRCGVVSSPGRSRRRWRWWASRPFGWARLARAAEHAPFLEPLARRNRARPSGTCLTIRRRAARLRCKGLRDGAVTRLCVRHIPRSEKRRAGARASGWVSLRASHSPSRVC
eukprot:Amastigsp_a340303_22.p2 type:complete len:155 gc:universal Amastigsp_a340303_22:539-75(-)